MNTPPNTLRIPENKHKPFPCRGTHLNGDGTSPNNIYHPAQVAFLMSIKRYTGRMMADIGHLPTELRSL